MGTGITSLGLACPSCNPVKDSEQEGFNPVVIISGIILNQYLPVVIMCPLNTKVKGYKGNVILEPDYTNGLTEKSEIVVSQFHSVSKSGWSAESAA